MKTLMLTVSIEYYRQLNAKFFGRDYSNQSDLVNQTCGWFSLWICLIHFYLQNTPLGFLPTWPQTTTTNTVGQLDYSARLPRTRGLVISFALGGRNFNCLSASFLIPQSPQLFPSKNHAHSWMPVKKTNQLADSEWCSSYMQKNFWHLDPSIFQNVQPE